MIKLTRLSGTDILLNEKFIEMAEETPDTVVCMQNGHSYVVKQSIDEIMDIIGAGISGNGGSKG